MAKREELIVGLDIGTTKICAIVGEVDRGRASTSSASARTPSQGPAQGRGRSTSRRPSRRSSTPIEEAELMAGCEITSVYAGIAGGHIRGFNSHGIVAVKDKEVDAADVDARDRRGQGDRHPARPRGHPRAAAGVHRRRPGRHPRAARHERRAPRGQGAHRHRRGHQRAEHHQVRQPLRPATSPTSCSSRSPRAEAVLDGRREGARRRAHRHRRRHHRHRHLLATARSCTPACSPLGGNHLTNDIAVGPAHARRTRPSASSRSTAARLTALVSTRTRPSRCRGSAGASRACCRARCCAEIIEPRVEEIFTLVQQRDRARPATRTCSRRASSSPAARRILDGMPELAEQVLGLPVRRGAPRGVGGLVDVVKSPMYATGVGLVLYGAKNCDLQPAIRSRRRPGPAAQRGSARSF